MLIRATAAIVAKRQVTSVNTTDPPLALSHGRSHGQRDCCEQKRKDAHLQQGDIEIAKRLQQLQVRMFARPQHQRERHRCHTTAGRLTDRDIAVIDMLFIGFEH